jgi:pyrimidine operon attenuation protein / uracil phosphoribosyltransferase
MNLQIKRIEADAARIEKSLKDISKKIIKNHPGLNDVVLIGIRTRGVFLAERLKKLLLESSGIEVPSGIFDITLYRDDLTSVGPQPVVNKTIINFNIAGKKVIFVDDVFYTGRTMRAALDELMDFGRPAFVEIAVLADRGRRELPIRPDYTGMNIETSEEEIVQVNIKETDGEENIAVAERP